MRIFSRPVLDAKVSFPLLAAILVLGLIAGAAFIVLWGRSLEITGFAQDYRALSSDSSVRYVVQFVPTSASDIYYRWCPIGVVQFDCAMSEKEFRAWAGSQGWAVEEITFPRSYVPGVHSRRLPERVVSGFWYQHQNASPPHDYIHVVFNRTRGRVYFERILPD